MNFYNASCNRRDYQIFIQTNFASGLSSRVASQRLLKLKDPNFYPRGQVIDRRFKCKYLVTKNNTVIPVMPSVSIYNLPIINSPPQVDFKNMITNLRKIDQLSNSKIGTDPVGVYYSEKKGSKLNIIGILVGKYQKAVPIKPTWVNEYEVKKQKLFLENRSLNDKIDNEIDKGKDNFIIDSRISKVNRDLYANESYHLFKLELSNYISHDIRLREKITSILVDKKMNRVQKQIEIKKQFYRITNRDLYKNYLQLNGNQIGGEGTSLSGGSNGLAKEIVHTYEKEKDLNSYQVKNTRTLCQELNKNECQLSYHCHFSHNSCKLSLSKEMIIKFINKAAEEVVDNRLRAQELLQEDKYFVSDIVFIR